MDITADSQIHDDDLTCKTSIVLQVHKSHLERVVDFLKESYVRSVADADADGDAHHDVSLDENTDDEATPKSEKKDGINSTPSKRRELSEENTKNPTQVEIIEIVKLSASKTLSIILLHALDTNSFLQHLLNKSEFILKALNKVYVLSNNHNRLLIKTTLSFASVHGKNNAGENQNRVLDSICLHLYNTITQIQQYQKRQITFKIETFPHKIQQKIVTNLFSMLEKNSIPEEELDIGPSNQTHTLSIIQLGRSVMCRDAMGRQQQKTSFLVGIAPVDDTVSPFSPPEQPNDDVCRAFYKLKEAFDRYSICHENNTNSNSEKLEWPFPTIKSGSKRKTPSDAHQPPIIGVDCGSAPGGWTKYLIEQTACNEIYSIDPGEMAESIVSLPNVHHLKMTAEKAIPHISKILSSRRNDDHNEGISIWVSDMCVHELTKQVDVFLIARNAGIFRPGMAFVLTIKCNVGHAKERFEEITEKEVNRLKDVGAYGLRVIHLFSNRNGERTVMGFIG